MRTQGWRSLTLYILTGLFILGMGVFAFRLGTQGASWAMQPYNRHLKTEGGTTQGGGEAVWAGTIVDRDGTVLVESEDGERHYRADMVPA